MIALITHKDFFPAVLILLDLCAAARYAWEGGNDWWRAGYWFAAAAITVCATMTK
jgi:hypothetical protein